MPREVARHGPTTRHLGDIAPHLTDRPGNRDIQLAAGSADAEVHLLDAGHFATETNADEIAGYIRDFLPRAGERRQ